MNESCIVAAVSSEHRPDDVAALSDGDLARAIADRGDHRAEETIVRRFGRRVQLFGLRHLRDQAAADDLAQEVMATVIERLRDGRVREPDRIGSFILGTARMMARDTRRRERRAAEVAEAAALEQRRAELPSPSVDSERLARALAELPERERAVVVLTFQQDRSAREIAQTFDLQPGHVRVIRHRAIARLAALMGVGEVDPSEAV
jgi:RNA polymerase sigma-70 factor (ECF subfamily)